MLTKTCLKFNRKFQKQTDGVAMGKARQSSVIAEIYMQAHESTALTTTSNPPKVWERFVDDVFLIIKKYSLEGFFKHVNSLHDQIKFTMETETDSRLPFLDTLIKQNDDGSISILLYIKAHKRINI